MKVVGILPLHFQDEKVMVEEVLEEGNQGANQEGVAQQEGVILAVEFAKKKGIALYARATGSERGGTVVRRDVPAGDKPEAGGAVPREAEKPFGNIRAARHDERIELRGSAWPARPAVPCSAA